MTNKDSLWPLKMLLFSFYGANTMVVSFLPLLLTYRGLSAQEIGWVLAIGPAVSIIAQPFWGFISTPTEDSHIKEREGFSLVNKWEMNVDWR